MHALIIVAHPNPQSLTHGIAAHLGEGIAEKEGGDSFEIADLMAEGFDPRFSAQDAAAHHRTSPPAGDVLAEQARIDRSDALVFVYPVYWWSMPGLLKGWIDRVFSNGWAYDDAGTKVEKKLRHLRIHLVGIGGADAGTYDRHGYFTAMKTQIDHGIFDYCGARVITSDLLLEADTVDPAIHLEAARRIGKSVFSSRSEEPDAA